METAVELVVSEVTVRFDKEGNVTHLVACCLDSGTLTILEEVSREFHAVFEEEVVADA